MRCAPSRVTDYRGGYCAQRSPFSLPEYTAIRIACLALLVLLLAGPAPTATAPRAPGRGAAVVPDRVQLRKRHLDRWLGKHRIHANVYLPEVTGLANPALQARINRTIRSAYPPALGIDQWLELNGSADDLEPGLNIEFTGDYEVTFNRNQLLSIQFYGSDDTLKNGLIVAPHPNSQMAAVTLDTRTGKAYKLSDLFTGPRWRDRLEQLITRSAGVGMHDTLPPEVREQLPGELKHHEYWYYLTRRGICFYDLYQAWVLHAVTSEISLEQLRPLMNPKGPLPSLLAGVTRKAPARPITRIREVSPVHKGAERW
jgi:hypothetical protein